MVIPEGAKAVFGLGNPGRKYKGNRHNIGFMVVEALAVDLGAGLKRSLFLAGRVGSAVIEGRRVLLVEPSTYMNRSGACVAKVVARYALKLSDILFVHDEVDLPLGEVRVRQKGSSAGHRGMASIIQALQTQSLSRVRVGIARPENGAVADHVLSDFLPAERPAVKEVVSLAKTACLQWLRYGFEKPFELR
ncbi:MAG: aminoacyl-tRNA hydrolase [Omnitrophica WOR_2 bacterium RBG_13_44_8b]|nr:MAG: aminoacyl-tRNA hydrolase [Omnitrophica WOR_2 bacterium RBG_13_44_8b]